MLIYHHALMMYYFHILDFPMFTAKPISLKMFNNIFLGELNLEWSLTNLGKKAELQLEVAD